MEQSDSFSEEELAEAEQLAQQLEIGAPPQGRDTGDLSEASAHVALLQASMNLSLSESAQAVGRAEVLEQAQRAATRKASSRREARPHLAWMAWLPLPAILLFALAFGLRQTTQSLPTMKARGETAGEALEGFRDSSQDERTARREAPSSPIATPSSSPHASPPREVVPPLLLEAQARLLSARLAGREPEKKNFDLAMQDYRARLLTQLEQEVK